VFFKAAGHGRADSAIIFKGERFMTIETSKGMIDVSPEVIAIIAGHAATNCFGVKGMTFTGATDDIVRILRRETMSKGVKVRRQDDGVELDLHIAVHHGINISAVCHSIISEVSYHVEKLTSVPVKRVNIFVDSIRIG